MPTAPTLRMSVVTLKANVFGLVSIGVPGCWEPAGAPVPGRYLTWSTSPGSIFSEELVAPMMNSGGLVKTTHIRSM